jgi:predicted TIM-barrel fold metal-dependent hydrolase
MMQDLELDQALVSPMPAFFYTDPGPANDRLLRRLKGRASLWAVPIVNARVSDACKHVEQLARRPQVKAVRLAPGFHGYPVAEAKNALQVAAEAGLAAVIQLRMQDERSHPVASRVPPVLLEEVINLAASVSTARVVVAAARLAEIETSAQAERIRALPNLWLDISHVDGLDCLGRARRAVGPEKLLFATSWPFFYARSAALKVEETELPSQEAEMVMGRNAAQVFCLAAH